MDVLNFDNAVSAYNNLEAYQSQKQQQLKDLVQQYREGAEQTILPAIELYQRGKGLYNKLTGEKSAATEGESAATEGENALSGAISEGRSALSGLTTQGESAVSGAIQGAEGVASETLGSLSRTAESAISGVTSRLGEFSSSIRGIGNQLSERMRTNAFERDPEAEIASGEDNMGILDRVQSVFRGGVSEATQGAESAVSGVRGAISGAVEGAQGAVSGATEAATAVGEGVATAVGETIGAVAADAIPVIGEISMLALGVFDFVKSFTEKPPPVQAYAAPVYEKGI